MFAARSGFFTRPAGLSVPVAFDAVGAGNTGTTTSLSWTHTATAGAYVVVGVATAGDVTLTATYGGAAMSSLGRQYGNNTPGGVTEFFGLNTVAGGAKTVAATLSTATYGCANSVSYLNVGSVSAPTYSFGSGQNLSISATCSANQKIVAGLAGNNTAVTLGSLAGGVNRFSVNSGGAAALAVSDADVNTTFTAFNSSGFPAWSGIAVVLIP